MIRRRCPAAGRRRLPTALAVAAVLAAAAGLRPQPLAAQTEAAAAATAQPVPPAAPSAAAAAAPAARGSEGVLPTLMFSLGELMQIEAALREGGLGRDTGEGIVEAVKPRLRDRLYLSGIVYGGVGDWTVWLNGRPLRPAEPKGNLFEVIEVTPRQVVLLVAWGDTTRQVVLEPNQTFDPAYGRVVEGRGL